MKIAGKVAVVTGAAGGIGYATAEKLVQREIAALGLVDQSSRIAAVTTALNAAAGRECAVAFCGDVTDATFRQQVFTELQQQFGGVQISIPAAGILRDGLAVTTRPRTPRPDTDIDMDTTETATDACTLYSETDFRAIMAINLLHPSYWAMELVAGIARARQQQGLAQWRAPEPIQGVNILLGSVSARGNRGQVAYAASKAGLAAVATTLNVEGLIYGVQTKIIHPGLVDTPMVDSIAADYFARHLQPKIGLQRKITPAEIGEIICTMIENPVLSGPVWADASMTPFA